MISSKLRPKKSPKVPNVYIIAGIGGCDDEFRELLQLIMKDFKKSRDQLIIIGPAMGYGFSSKEVIQGLIALQQKINLIFVPGWVENFFADLVSSGNAKEMMMYYERLRHMNISKQMDQEMRETEHEFKWISKGGRSIMLSYVQDNVITISESHLNFIGESPVLLETESEVYLPAPIPSKTGWAGAMREIENGHPWPTIYFGKVGGVADLCQCGKFMVCGGVVVKEPEVNHLGMLLDTGCQFSGHLTCVRLPDFKRYSVKAKSNYFATIPYDFMTKPIPYN